MTATTPCTQHPDKWFSQDPKNVTECLTMCRTTCPLQQTCLELALTHTETGPDSGIWGGELPETRRQMLETQEGRIHPVEAVPEKRHPQLVGAA